MTETRGGAGPFFYNARKYVAQRFEKHVEVCVHAAVKTKMFSLLLMTHQDRHAAFCHKDFWTSLAMKTATKHHAQTARTGNFAGTLAELLSTLSLEAVLEEAAHELPRAVSPGAGGGGACCGRPTVHQEEKQLAMRSSAAFPKRPRNLKDACNPSRVQRSTEEGDECYTILSSSFLFRSFPAASR